MIKTEDIELRELVKQVSLKHVAIIMDGNRRWAKNNLLPSSVGHQKGAKSFKNIVKLCHKFGIKYLTVYAFSTENWNRKAEEVNFLMNLLAKTISQEIEELKENNVKLKFIGDLTRFNENLFDILKNAEKETAQNSGINVQIAINYGSREEIVNATKQIAEDFKNGLIEKEDINEELFSNKLYTKEIPDPDLLIRTGGEYRISNYLLWQISYSEFYVTQVLWPDFGEEEFSLAIKDFAQRQRRYGK